MSSSLDLRAYNLLLDELRCDLNTEMTGPPCDVITEPTHRLDQHINHKIQVLTILQKNIAYTALKIKQLKEQIGAHEHFNGVTK